MAKKNQRRHLAGAPSSMGGRWREEERADSERNLFVPATKDFVSDHVATVPSSRWAPNVPEPSEGAYHVMNYRSEQLNLKMPSKAFITRWMKQTGETEFNLPVTAERNGNKVSGWVRVRRAANGGYVCHTMGFSNNQNARDTISEGVASVLEARRVRQSLSEIGDLSARAAAARAGVGTSRKVYSSWISRVGYHDGVMTITTDKGASYGWKMGEEDFKEFFESKSKGKGYWKLKRAGLLNDPVDVDSCEHCNGVYAEGLIHRCPSWAKA